MMTPIGNPQNLNLYQLGGYEMGEFLNVMFPFTAASGVLLVLCLLFIPGKMQELESEGLDQHTKAFARKEKRNIGIYLILFVLALCVVLRLIPFYIVLGIVMVLVFFLERKILRQVDYCLLLTFICFFIFIGNLGALPVFREALEQVVSGRELLAGVLSSQVVSNVPASLLLSSFTTDYNALFLAVLLVLAKIQGYSL